MVGDKTQLPLVVLSDSKINNFSSLLQMLFQWLKLLGQPLVLHNRQYQMVDAIGSIVLMLFYSSQLANGLGIEI